MNITNTSSILLKNKIFAFLFYFGISILLFFPILISPGQIFAVDWGLPPTQEHASLSLANYFYMWNNENVFGDRSINVASLLFKIYVWIISLLGADGGIIGKVTSLLLFTLSGFSIYNLCKYLEHGEMPSIIAGLFFMSTPLHFDYISMGFLSVLASYAILPLAIVSFDISIKKMSFKYCMITGLLYGIAIWNVQSILIYPIVLFLYYIFVHLSFKTIIQFVKSVIVIMVVAILINAYWIIPLSIYPPAIIPSYSFVTDWRAAELNTVNLLRLWGSTFNYQFETLFSSSLLPITFIPVIVAYSALVFKPKNRYVLFFSVLSVLTFFIFESRYNFVSLPISYISAFRDVTRFIIFISISYSVLISFTLDFLFIESKRTDVIDMFKSRRRNCLISLTCIIGILLLNTYPWWIGGINSIPTTFKDTRIRTYQFPVQYYELENWLSVQKDDFKVLWLPTGGSLNIIGNKYFDGPFQSIQQVWSSYSAKPGGFSLGYEKSGPTYNFERFLLNTIDKNNTSNLGEILGRSNVKYIVVLNNTKSSGMSSQYILNMLYQQKDLTKVMQNDNIIIFENDKYLPHIYIGESYAIVEDWSVISNSKISNYKLDKPNILFFLSQLRSSAQVEYIVNNSDNILLEKDQLLDLVFSLIPQEYIISPDIYTKGFDLKKEWSDLFLWNWQTEKNFTVREKVIVTAGSRANITIPLNINKERLYDIWVQAYQGTENGNTSVFVDKSNIGTVNGYNNFYSGFKWFYVNSLYLSYGSHELIVENNNGKNFIGEIVVTPQYILTEMADKANKLTQENYDRYNTREYNKTKIVFQKLNPAKYNIHVNTTAPFFLVFSESYSPYWKAYVDEPFKYNENDIIVHNENIKEVIAKQVFFEPNDLELYFKDNIPDANHFIVNGYENAWHVDRIGEYDIILYFEPQTYFFIGLIIFGLTFIGIIGFYGQKELRNAVLKVNEKT